MRLKRDDLYRELWAEPVSVVAPRYGLSDVGLAKICRRLNVPRPPRGYWQQLKAGKAPRKLSLPALRAGDPDFVEVTKRLGAPAARASTSESAQAERRPERRIHVDDVLTAPHRYVASAARSLRNARADDRGTLVPRAKRRLDIRVTKATLDRALRVMDALLKAFDTRELPVTISADQPSKTSVTVLQQTLEFFIEEPVGHQEHRPTADERLLKKLNPWRDWPRFDHVPSGLLRLRIANAGYLGVRRTWGDGKKQRLEHQLNSFVEGLVRAAHALQEEQARQEERRLRWAQEEQERAERFRAQELEERRVSQLDLQIGRWEKAQRVRRYVEALKRCGSVELPDHVEIGTFDEWLGWTSEYAGHLDPFEAGGTAGKGAN